MKNSPREIERDYIDHAGIRIAFRIESDGDFRFYVARSWNPLNNSDSIEIGRIAARICEENDRIRDRFIRTMLEAYNETSIAIGEGSTSFTRIDAGGG